MQFLWLRACLRSRGLGWHRRRTTALKRGWGVLCTEAGTKTPRPVPRNVSAQRGGRRALSGAGHGHARTQAEQPAPLSPRQPARSRVGQDDLVRSATLSLSGRCARTAVYQHGKLYVRGAVYDHAGLAPGPPARTRARTGSIGRNACRSSPGRRVPRAPARVPSADRRALPPDARACRALCPRAI
jgi:hypothetical protein